MAAITVCSDLEMVILYQIHTNTYRASLIIQSVKNLPAVQESQVLSLGWEDPLEKEIAPTPVLLPGKSHGWRSVVGYSPWGRKEPDMTSLSLFTFTSLTLK